MLILKPFETFTVRSDWHRLWLTEKNDRWYMGAGPTQRKGTIFGYIQRPSNGKSELAKVVDVSMKYEINKYLSITGYYSHVFGGEVIDKLHTEDEDSDFFYLEGAVKF